jgi:membrane protein YqaA with SNARE-associated domain
LANSLGVVADYLLGRAADAPDREARRKAKAAPATQPANG